MDPRTPVLVAAGQINQRDDAQIEPVDLMAAAAREAADPTVLQAVDAIRVVNLLSWRYRDPGLLLGERIGARNPSTYYTGVGGNTPQSLVNQACLDIQQGRAEVVLLAGGETWRNRKRMQANGIKPAWTRQGEDVAVPPGAEDEVPMSSPAEERIGLLLPSHVYPLFEQALRIARGESVADHQRRVAELWSRFSAVAADNPQAWSRDARSAEEIGQAGPDNRMISWPYPKLMNSNNMVNQAAVVILCSAEKATALQIPRDQWIFPYAGTDSHDTYSVAERHELHRSPAIRIAGRRALELAGVGVDDLAHVDVYSCFPSAVQVAAGELGLATDDPQRPLTVTGGLTFAGGPWNNYVMHSIATMAGLLRDDPAAYGLITANGGFLTKHSFGVYSATPPPAAFRWEDVQSEVDREPTRTAVVEWEGEGTVESWTTPFDRDGRPEKAFLAVRTPDDARAMAVIDDADAAAVTVAEDIAGAKVRVHADGRASLS
ncbi:acetyl-CoA acetyltransferase [Mycolicibacterium aichiense]|uniref:Acetyl-CoA acetyltransferase n=1 Tax=Mycolicibacterium aichiense TaxID=1799 RepID=A0AAD1HMJ9_9MYCO|nr:acetyl-CoA acetyltransferase [Mycolicibacterium aichiense]MCV7019567.1 acetyl-CoA acetyltransferase [Mycolicibacterium aichiense]BBX08122.1 acetyl-CoA acetyltransferase [Mycolicibacterium aichiense]STZ81927.1 acetyl-CoA acetyltransferase [Mycolicibacterium aichiense]